MYRAGAAGERPSCGGESCSSRQPVGRSPAYPQRFWRRTRCIRRDRPGCGSVNHAAAGTRIPRAQYVSLPRFLSGFSGSRKSRNRLNPLESTRQNGPNPPFRKPLRINYLPNSWTFSDGLASRIRAPDLSQVPNPPFCPCKSRLYSRLRPHGMQGANRKRSRRGGVHL